MVPDELVEHRASGPGRDLVGRAHSATRVHAGPAPFIPESGLRVCTRGPCGYPRPVRESTHGLHQVTTPA